VKVTWVTIALVTGCGGDPDVPEDTGTSEQAERDVAWAALVEDVEGWLDYDSAVGLGFAVVLDGELAYSSGMGVTQYGGGVPVNPDTVFRWNSVSKFHTALAVMQLVEAGHLDLEAPATELLPDLSLSGTYDASELTLHRMMTHTSALPDFWLTNCDVELDDLWQTWSPSLEVEPGQLFNYSNAGWSLAGRLVEVASGESFTDYIQENVLAPAGMETATFDVDEAISGLNYTFGYDGVFYTPDIHDCPYVRPAGWLHASPVDLGRMAEVMLAGGQGLVSESSVDEITEMLFETGYASGSSYGYGLYTWEHGGVKVLGHLGGGAGHLSYFMMAPDQGFAVVAASNTSFFNPYALAERAADLFLEQDADWIAPEEYTEPSSWSEYVGTYEDPINVGTIVVSLNEDEKLYVRFEDGSNIDRRLYQYANDEFFYEYDGYVYIRFARDPESGAVRFFANRYFVGDQESVSENDSPPHSEEQVAEILREGAELELRGPERRPGPR